MQRELLLHAHLMCLNRFDADMQFTCQFGNAEASADKRKISSSRSLRLSTPELCERFEPAAKLLRISGKTLALTYSRPAEISSKALTISAAPSRVKYPRAPERNARRTDSGSVRSESTSVAAAGSSLQKSLIS